MKWGLVGIFPFVWGVWWDVFPFFVGFAVCLCGFSSPVGGLVCVGCWCLLYRWLCCMWGGFSGSFVLLRGKSPQTPLVRKILAGLYM